MKKLIAFFAIIFMLTCNQVVVAQENSISDSVENVTVADSETMSVADSALKEIADFAAAEGLDAEGEESPGAHQVLKTKFIEGNPWFMSLVAMALIIGLTFCIEQIVYLLLSEINTRRFLKDIDLLMEKGDKEAAKELCRNTRGPVASVCYQALSRINESSEAIERSVAAYGSVLASNLEKGCQWITLCISVAPSLGFLGTVVGMVMAFDDIRVAGDISTSIVAEGMQVALITTIFGIIAAVVLQVFYNYILSRIDRLVAQMEEAAITMLDMIARYKQSSNSNG